MIKFEDLKQAVIAAKKEEFELEVVSCSKRHFPGVRGYSVRDFLDEYNKIMGLEDECAYIWETLGKCYSLADLRDDIRRNVPEYTAALFDRAVAVIGVYDFNIASAYALIANYIRKGGKICGIYE
jgi:hypothetical protein|nr:MAG TPA: hypothetical protein [Bacteriophage sp.]